MSRRVMRKLLVLGACAALSCEHPTGPTLRPTDTEAPPAGLDIVDAVHLNGNPHFFFLPPLVAEPSTNGVFDATLLGSLAVDVCVLSTNGCAGPAIKHFVSTSGTGPERLTVNAADHFYTVSWNTGAAIVDPAKNYRIRVSAGSTLLGRIDVDVVPNADALARVDRTQFAAVVKGDWLALRFRVETGAVGANAPPALAIAAPVNAQHFRQGVSISFAANASDAEDGDLSSHIQWKVDGTQALGTGATVSAALLAGDHVVTASVSDSRGASAQASVAFVVDSGANHLPTATIRGPASGTSVSQGTAVQFTGWGSDPDEAGGMMPASVLVWTSSLDGQFGAGYSVTRNTLRVGVHTITLTVTDSEGATDTAMIVLTVTAVPMLGSFKVTPRSLTLGPLDSTPYRIDIEKNGVPFAAPAGGVPLSFQSSNSVCADVPGFYYSTIPPGASSTTVWVQWGRSASLPCSAIIWVAAPGMVPDSVLVTVAAAPLLRFSTNPSVGSGLLNGSYWVQLAANAPAGGVTVHLAPVDNTLLLLSPGFDNTSPGTGSLDVLVPAGSFMAFFNVSGVEGRTGTTWIRATAPGYVGDSTLATVQRPAFQIVGLPDSMAARGSAAFQVQIGIESQSYTGPSLATMSLRAGAPPVTITITNSAPAVGELVTFGPVARQTGTVQIAGAVEVRSPAGGAAAHGIELHALAPGSTTVTASIPGWFPFNGGTKTVTITP